MPLEIGNAKTLSMRIACKASLVSATVSNVNALR